MTDTATLKPGLRLRSQVCATEVIVVRPGVAPHALTCGGALLVGQKDEVSAGGSPAAGLDSGSLLGKRYTAVGDDGLELLVTKAGAGTLADGSEPLVLKEARPLPASD